MLLELLKGEEEHGEAEKISGGQDHMSYLVKIFSECQAIFITCSSVQRRLKQRLERAVTIVLAKTGYYSNDFITKPPDTFCFPSLTQMGNELTFQLQLLKLKSYCLLLQCHLL